MKRIYLKGLLTGCLGLFITFGIGVTATKAQPTAIDITLKDDGGGNLEVFIRPNGGLSAPTVYSDLTFSIAWETASGAVLGAVDQFSYGGPPFCVFQSLQLGLSGGVTTNGGNNYQAYNGQGGAFPSSGCDWVANVEIPWAKIAYTAGAGCANFQIITDAHTDNENTSFFTSVGGVDVTGVIYGPGVSNIGNCAMDDCNGDPGGTAMVDNCGVCAGGNTGLVPNADEDCFGDCNGTAAMDNCGVCAGGNTGIIPNVDEDCLGVCFGSAVVDCFGDCDGTAAMDNCGICAGGNTGLVPNVDEDCLGVCFGSAVVDCNGDCDGTAALDNCGICAGGNTGITPCPSDCNGDPGGTAMVDNCGVCAGGNTGLVPNADEDCNGDCNGTAAMDNCGVCAGGNTGLVPNVDEDCLGVCFGTAMIDCNGDCDGIAAMDNCGVCAGGNTGLIPNADEDCLGDCFGTAVVDCNGDCDGTAGIDNCGICAGGNTGITPCNNDCNSDPGGSAMIDNCGVCAGGNTGLIPNTDEDCNGDCFGAAAMDNCGVCAGGNTGLVPNADEDCLGVCFGSAVLDCNGDCDGTAAIDNCGVCAEGNTGLVPNVDEDCLGVCFGSAVVDCNGDCDGTAAMDNCGICAGGNTGITPCNNDCNSDPGGSAMIDNCGVCAGGNTGLIPNTDEDCNGDCFGAAAIDNCGVCADGNTGLVPNADEDCLGVCFGSAVLDCNGDCDGTAAIDNCGVCAEGNTGLVPNVDEDCLGVCFGSAVVDCNGDCDGTAAMDNCGICAGGNTGITPCNNDCNSDPGGSAMIDNCGVCAGGNTGLIPNADEDCNGDCFGMAAMDNCGLCAGGNTGLVPNADEDCLGVCFGTDLPNTSCDDGDPNTINDMWDMNCVCAGIPSGGCTENLTLTINTDDMGSETTWEIVNHIGNIQEADGGPYIDTPGGTTETALVCLHVGCYDLFVYDSFGDGIIGGGYVLTDEQGRRIIDNSLNGEGGGSVSTLANGVGWCVPIENNALIGSSTAVPNTGCDKLTYEPNDYFIAQPVAAVNPTNGDGYQFWMFDPNGTYSRRIFQTNGGNNNGWSNADPNDACYLRFGWLQTLPVPHDLMLNVRVRAKISSVYQEFGPVCLALVTDPNVNPDPCSITQLVDEPNNPNYSCDVMMEFGGSDKVVAYPLADVDKYKFHFEDQNSAFVRNIAGTSNARVLSWATSPLQDGATYDVSVAVSYDGGATYCPFGPSCPITIANPPSAQGRDVTFTDEFTMNVYPNPNRGQDVNLNLEHIQGDVDKIQIDLFDSYGKIVHHETVYQPGDDVRMMLKLDYNLSEGVYIISVQFGDEIYTEMLVVQ